MLKVCSKANRKLTTVSRMLKFLMFKKKRVLIKAYFKSWFKYCPLLWMFQKRQVNNKINHLHERSLKIIYEDSTSLFDTLLEKDMSFSFHDRNIQQLAQEIYRITKGFAPKCYIKFILAI